MIDKLIGGKKHEKSETFLLKKNQLYEIEVNGMTHDGMGVGRVKGFAVFIQGAVEGDTVLAKIIKVAKSYAVARIDKIIIRSIHRTQPFCKSFKFCGGCSLQHISYEKQLQFKKDVVTNNLARIGGLKDVTIHNTTGMKNPYNYRNKARFPLGFTDGKPAIGFYKRRSHDIIEFEKCDIQSLDSCKIKDMILKFINKHNIPVYNEEKHEGLLRYITVRQSFYTKEIMVILVSTKNDIPHQSVLIEELISAFPKIKSIILNINDKKQNVILGEKNITVYGKDTIQYVIGNYRFEVSPSSFLQVNSVQTRKLYDKVTEYAALKGNETVFDLYCGIGTISIYLSGKAKRVIGVEVVSDAVKNAQKNAEINFVNNVEFYQGKAEEVVPGLYKKGLKSDVVVVDPPRKGCDAKLLETIVNMQPQKIIYVSCKPSTLARDLKFLTSQRYKVMEVQPVDMFPHTKHVETVALITRV